MPYRVLIVDDQKDISRLLRSALETIESGLVVSEAPSGEEALLEAGHTRIDLLVADYRLPGMTGVELLKKFRSRFPASKIIMVSGITDPRFLKEVTDAVPDAFFQKPVPMSDFLATVERCLGLARIVLDKNEITRAAAPKLEERLGVGDILINLRKDLKAQAVMLFTNMGQVQAEAGDLPEPNARASLISSLMTIFTAAQKASSLLDRSGSHLHLFNGVEMDGIFLPVGTTHALLLAGKGLADSRILSSMLKMLYTARDDLLAALNATVAAAEAVLEPPTQPISIGESLASSEDLPGDFMEIFTQLGKKGADASSFWDTAVEKGTTFNEPDKLTYEQASRLGLTPDN